MQRKRNRDSFSSGAKGLICSEDDYENSCIKIFSGIAFDNELQYIEIDAPRNLLCGLFCARFSHSDCFCKETTLFRLISLSKHNNINLPLCPVPTVANLENNELRVEAHEHSYLIIVR